MEPLTTIILRQAQDEVKSLKMLTLTLSLSSRQRRPEAAKGEGGRWHLFSGLLEQDFDS